MPTASQRRQATEAVARLCASNPDPFTLRSELVGLLRRAVPFDGCCFVSTDPAAPAAGGTSFLFHEVPTGNVGRIIFNELNEEDFNKFDVLGRSLWPVGILSEATDGELERSPRYRELLVPQAATDELRAACVVDGARWGSLTLVRRGGRFDEEDAAVVGSVAEQVARALRRGLLAVGAASSRLDDRAGLLLIDEHNRITSATPAG